MHVGDEGELAVRVDAWRRLGNAIEGLACDLKLAEGVYRLEFDTRAENVQMWSMTPMHYAGGEEIVDPDDTSMRVRRSFDAPGPHGWLRWQFFFRVPQGAERTWMVLFPLDKVIFSQPAELSIRNWSLATVREA
jgi:hypothetical protein